MKAGQKKPKPNMILQKLQVLYRFKLDYLVLSSTFFCFLAPYYSTNFEINYVPEKEPVVSDE